MSCEASLLKIVAKFGTVFGYSSGTRHLQPRVLTFFKREVAIPTGQSS